jgi:sugar lactone lactonase YvrE
MAVRCASAQSVVFTPSGANHIANAYANPTDTTHQAYVNRVSTNQRGDIFWVNNPYSYGASGGSLTELPVGASTPVFLIKNLAANSQVATVDPSGNVWLTNGPNHVLYVPFLNGAYPASIDLSVTTPPECTVPMTGTAICDWPDIDPVSLGYYVSLTDLQVDVNGNIYAVSDYDSGVGRNRVLEYSGTTGAVTVVVDGLSNNVSSGRLAVTAGGDVYYADGSNLYHSVAGSGTATTITGFTSPNGVSLDFGGNLYVTDPGTNSLWLVPNVSGTLNFSKAYIVYNTLFYGQQVWGPVGVDGFGNLDFTGSQYGGDILQTQIATLPNGVNYYGLGGTLGPNTYNLLFTSAATFGSFSFGGSVGASPYTVSSTTCATGTAYAVGATCSVTVSYTATAVGNQPGVIEALSSTGTLLGEGTLSAYSIGPLMNIDPGTATAIGTTWHAPSGIAVDPAGNTYVVDRSTGGIYKNGSTTAIVSGFNSPSAVAVDTAGNLYVADTGNNRIQEIPYVGTSYGAPVTLYTGLSGPSGLTLDYSGNLYVADSGNARVLVLATAGTGKPGSIVSTVGSGFTTPVSVAVDNFDGYLFVADNGTKTIVRVNLKTSAQTTVGSGFTTLAGIALDAGNSLYAVDSGAQTISRLAFDQTVYYSPVSLGTVVSKPAALALDTLGNLYAVDTLDATVAKDNRSAGSLSFGSVAAGSSSSPLTATVTNGGGIYTSVNFNTPIYTESGNSSDFTFQSSSSCHPPSGQYDWVYDGPGCTISFVFNPVGAASYTDTLTISSSTTASNTLVLNGTGTAAAPAPVFGSLTVTGFPTSISTGTASYATVSAFDTTGAAMPSFTGTVTLTSSDPHATLPAAYTFTSSDAGVHSFPVTLNTGGTQSITATSGSISASETGIVVGDYIWIVNATGTTSKLSESGGSVTNSGLSAGTSAHGGLAFDSSGNVWSVTSGSNSLVFSTKSGATPTTYTGGGLSSPVGIAVDGAGSLWIANSGNNSVSEFLNSGTAQSGTAGYGASGMTALSGPSAVIVDGAGGVWVTNKTGNSLTHIIGAATPVVTPLSTAVATGSVGVEP